MIVAKAFSIWLDTCNRQRKGFSQYRKTKIQVLAKQYTISLNNQLLAFFAFATCYLNERNACFANSNTTIIIIGTRVAGILKTGRLRQKARICDTRCFLAKSKIRAILK